MHVTVIARMTESYPSAKGASVYTDWLLIRRLAWELNERFAGARVSDVGQLDDGRFGLAIWSRGRTYLLAVDVFAPTPVITLESGDLPIAVEPGFVRAAGAALRGMTLLAIRSRKGDRLLRFDFGSRSRFGVQDGYSLICELVPRFGNIVLVKGETIVAAVKEFAPAENAVRSIQAGDAYEPPPLRPGKSSPMLSDDAAADLAERVPDGTLHVYRRDGKLVQVHLAELPQYAELEHECADALLELLDEARRTHAHAQQSDRLAKHRRSLDRTLDDRERRMRTELAQVQARLREAANREELRAQGEDIYATLHEIDAAARDEAKERASELFAKYKKSVASVEHLERRHAELLQQLEELADLRWELERAGDAELDDVAQAVASLEPRHAPRARGVARKRKPLQYQTSHGSRIFVGRTPLENADLTFRVARPDDLWFHVQNQPGAHVILQRDDKMPAPEEDVLAAASLAALHSKAKNSPKVTVDYTQRKFVRKRPSSAPGLVFYTQPKSVYVEPKEPEKAPHGGLLSS
jgi:predicted ribosome quality control (RQC) complex YloA/Tae2 family protein